MATTVEAVNCAEDKGLINLAHSTIMLFVYPSVHLLGLTHPQQKLEGKGWVEKVMGSKGGLGLGQGEEIWKGMKEEIEKEYGAKRGQHMRWG